MQTLNDRSRLDDPMVQLTVPAVEIETARNEEAWDLFLTHLTQAVVPWLPDWFARWYGRFYVSGEKIVDETARLQSILMAHYAIGIPIVVGTDSGSWPHYPNFFHGPSTVREMELLVEGGMTPVEVLRAATLTPAEMMGIDDMLGTVELGKFADLIVVRGDPLTDISALRDLVLVIKNGEARTPREWMTGAPSIQ